MRDRPRRLSPWLFALITTALAATAALATEVGLPDIMVHRLNVDPECSVEGGELVCLFSLVSNDATITDTIKIHRFTQRVRGGRPASVTVLGVVGNTTCTAGDGLEPCSLCQGFSESCGFSSSDPDFVPLGERCGPIRGSVSISWSDRCESGDPTCPVGAQTVVRRGVLAVAPCE